MKILNNEKGSLLVYALFLILLISVITVPLLQMSSTRAMSDVRAKNQKIATNLAVSSVEEFLAYLKRCGACNDPSFHTKFIPSGIKPKSDPSRIIKLTLPDNTAATISISYESLGNNLYNVITRVVAGDTNQDHIANEKFAAMKEIIYRIDTTIYTGNLIRPGKLTDAPKTDKIYLDSKIMGDVSSSTKIEGLKAALNTYLGDVKKQFDDQIAHFKKTAIRATSLDDMYDKISQASNTPVIIKISSLNPEKDFTLNSSTKVILIVDHLTTGSNFKANNVDFIVGNLTMDDQFILTNGSLAITNSLSTKNNANLDVAGELYATNIIPSKNNSIDIKAERLIVTGTFEVKNNTTLTVQKEVLVGSMNVFNNADLNTVAGDFFVENSFAAGNNTSLIVGGSAAIGGSVKIDSFRTLQVGGVENSTILYPSGDGTSSGIINWSPTRQ